MHKPTLGTIVYLVKTVYVNSDHLSIPTYLKPAGPSLYPEARHSEAIGENRVPALPRRMMPLNYGNLDETSERVIFHLQLQVIILFYVTLIVLDYLFRLSLCPYLPPIKPDSPNADLFYGFQIMGDQDCCNPAFN
jgi:hypothetical protein